MPPFLYPLKLKIWFRARVRAHVLARKPVFGHTFYEQIFMKKKWFVETNILSLSKKGNGIGEALLLNGSKRIVEVPFAIPGDTVSALLLRKKKGIYKGLLQKVISPSPGRIAPRCVYFGMCGGCRWQQIPYRQQLEQKEKIVKDCLRPFLNESTLFYPILPSPSMWQYRNKMEFSFSQNASGERFLGLVIDSSKGKVFHQAECHLVTPWFGEALKAVRQWWQRSDIAAYHPPSNRGSLRTLTLREGTRTGDRMVLLTVSGNPDYALKKEEVEQLVQDLRHTIEPKDQKGRLSIFLCIQQTAKGIPTTFHEMLLYGSDHITEILRLQLHEEKPSFELTFKVSPRAFFQPNTEQAEKLYSLALQMASLMPQSVVYDLYCGTGTMGLCAAKLVQKVIGVELSQEAVRDARENAKQNGIHNYEVFQGDVSEVLREKKEEFPPPDVVMIDPPRAGLDSKAIEQLIRLSPPKIVYVSCNPYTQAENLAELTSSGYSLRAAQPVDQFPHTPHLENTILLEVC